MDSADWQEAESCARKVLAAADRRGNWLGVADAALAWSTTHLAGERVETAVAILARTLVTLRAHGAGAAAALLHARLSELRVELGPPDFDPVLEGVMRALRSRPR
jgi:hypothetical protein